MAVHEIFSQAIKIRYKASLCSKATVFYIIASVLTFIPPFLIAYRSQGFWKKINIYREQPDVHFKHKMLLVLETPSPNNLIVWSSYPTLDKLLKSHVKTKIPSIEHIEEDIDRDGRNDRLQMTIEVPAADEDIVSVKLLLVFDYKLHLYSSFRMEGLAYIHHNSPIPGSSLHVAGELVLHQREPLWHRGRDKRYEIPIIDESKADVDVYKLENILRAYSERNVSTMLDYNYAVWKNGRAHNEPFVIKLNIIYREETIQYRVGFWQLLKWAWIQYIAILVIFWFAFARIKACVFQRQLLLTMVYSPLKQEA